MKRIEIKLGDAVFYARLLEEQAPETCQALWNALPFGGRAVHAMWSGNMFRMLDAAPLDVQQVESGLSFQYPGLVVYYPPLKEIAFCYDEARFRGSAGAEYVTPLAEIEGDIAALAREAAKLQWEGATPITFSRAAEAAKVEPPVAIPVEGSQIEVAVDGQIFTATLLESYAPRTCAAFKALLPLEGKFTNTKWSGEMAHFWGGARELRGPIGLKVEPLEHPTRFHWPGYIYYHPSYDGIRLPYGDAQQSGAFTTSIMTALARFIDDDWPLFRELARQLYITGARSMSIRLK